MKTEHILAVEAFSFDEQEAEFAKVFASRPIDNSELFLVQRQRAENDEYYRHIIPYTVVMNKQDEILVYQRGKGAGEQRLAGLCSVGFGGHIDLADIRYENSTIDLERTLNTASLRELQEEIGIFGGSVGIEQAGFILDNSNPVGRVHVGILQVATFYGKSGSVTSCEDELTIIGWKKPEDIDVSTLEPWSQAVVMFLTGFFEWNNSVDEIFDVSRSNDDLIVSLTELHNVLDGVVDKRIAEMHNVVNMEPMVIPEKKSMWQKLAFWAA